MTTTPAAKIAPKSTAAKASEPKATKPAATTHTSHSDCTHAKIGREGKAARAACRRERATADVKA